MVFDIINVIIDVIGLFILLTIVGVLYMGVEADREHNKILEKIYKVLINTEIEDDED